MRLRIWTLPAVLILAVTGGAAYALTGGPGWLKASDEPTPRATVALTTSPVASPLASPTASPAVSPTASPAASPTPRKWRITVAIPRLLLGRDREMASWSPSLSDVKRWMPFPDAKPIWARYGTKVAKSEISFVAATSARLGDPTVEVNKLVRAVFGPSMPALTVLDPGPLGGAVRCAVHELMPDAVLCFWADEGSLGIMMLSGVAPAVAHKDFVRARAEVERKVPR